MKRLIQFTLLLLTVLSTHTLMAQGGARMGKDQHAKFEARLDEFSTRLSLTADQKEKVRSIMKNTRTEAKTIITTYTTPEDRRPKMIALALRTDDKINQLLDPKQQEIYKQYKAERKAKRQEMMKEQKEMRMEMDDAGIL